MTKHYSMKTEPGKYTLKGNDVALIHTVTAKAIKANRPLLSMYLIIVLANCVLSYFLSEWTSVAASVVFNAITFGVGYFMLQQVITITKETR